MDHLASQSTDQVVRGDVHEGDRMPDCVQNANDISRHPLDEHGFQPNPDLKLKQLLFECLRLFARSN